MATCPDCLKEITKLNKDIMATIARTCELNKNGELQEREWDFDPQEVTYSCPECSYVFAFTTTEDATAFLKGEKTA